MIGRGDKIKVIPRLSLVNEEKMNYVVISSVKIISLKNAENICHNRFFMVHYFP